MNATQTLFPLLSALSAGFLASRFRLPGGSLIWSLLAAAAVTLGMGLGSLPREVGLVGQLLLGAVLGSELSRVSFAAMRVFVAPLLAGLAALLVVSLAGGFLLAAMTSLPLVSALLATMPGGATDAVVFADAAGPDGAAVAAVHMTRQLLVVVVAATVVRRLFAR